MAEQTGFLPPRDTLRDLAAWFARARARWVLIGGVAAAFLGRPRVTKDVDAIVLAGNDDIERLLSDGAQHGFFPRISGAIAFAQQSRVLLMHHRPTSVGTDVSLGVTPFENETVARTAQTDIGGIVLPLPSPEDLIIMKSVAHRAIDLHDIDGILAAHPDVDQARIRRWVSEFAGVLEMPELLADVEKILTEHNHRLQKKRAKQ